MFYSNQYIKISVKPHPQLDYVFTEAHIYLPYKNLVPGHFIFPRFGDLLFLCYIELKSFNNNFQKPILTNNLLFPIPTYNYIHLQTSILILSQISIHLILLKNLATTNSLKNIIFHFCHLYKHSNPLYNIYSKIHFHYYSKSLLILQLLKHIYISIPKMKFFLTISYSLLINILYTTSH